MNSVSGANMLKYLLLLYILSLGFTDLLDLPFVGKKIQLPEIVFIPLFLVWLVAIRNHIPRLLKPGVLEAGLAVYILVMMLSVSFSNSNSSWLEILGIVYLVTVFIIYKSSLQLLPGSNFFVTLSICLSGIIASVSGITGWILSQLGFATILSMPADIQYPYLGPVARATGFMNSPNMLFNFLSVCLLILISQWKQNDQLRKTIHVAVTVISVGIILTFSKSILLLVIGILFLLSRQNIFITKISRLSVSAFCVLLFITWLLGTHFLIRKPTSLDLTTGAEKAYTVATPVAHLGNYDVYLTNYTINKQAAIYAGIQNPILGVGPGNFNSFIASLKNEGRYPPYFINFDPHSTYVGAFAETGFLGLAALLLVWYLIFRTMTSSKAESDNDHRIIIGLAACFLFMAMEAISMDVMNFRHLWVLMGILAFLFAKQTHNIKTIGKNQQA